MSHVKENTQEFVSIRKAVSITGIGAQTLRTFADSKKIPSYRTPSGQRKFHLPSLRQMCAVSLSSPTEPDDTKRNFIYTRVSSHHQLDDLSRQISFISSRPEYASYDVVQDVGSGINFKRKGLQTILDCCLQKCIGNVVVAHKDRLARFAFDLIERLIQKAGGEVIVLGNQEHHASDEQELAEDLLAITHVFACKQMGKRRYKKTKCDSPTRVKKQRRKEASKNDESLKNSDSPHENAEKSVQ